MEVLIHLGLNKCASTYIQHALCHVREQMVERGVWFPTGPNGTGQYSLSRHYGFGPDVQGLATETVADIVKSAKSKSCHRLILSSEYFSLQRPNAASRIVRDLELSGCDATYLLFSRELVAWVRSLFNQYVRTVEDGRHLRTIDNFVDQVLANRAIDVGSRYKMWVDLVGKDNLAHYRLGCETSEAAVLQPFSDFAGMPISVPENAARNSSVQPNALYRIGHLRSRFRNREEEAELSRLLSGEPCLIPAPTEYMQISPERLARLQTEIGDTYEALPYLDLDEQFDHTPKATTAAA